MDNRPPDRQDLDSLLDWLLAFAEQTLRKYGEFYPFGAVLTVSGEIVAQAGKLVETDRPPSQAIIDLITEGIQGLAQAGTIRAGGVCYDVKMRSPDGTTVDAIDVALEHQSGLAVLVTQPYSKRRFGGFQFGELSAQAGEVRLFTDVDASRSS